MCGLHTFRGCHPVQIPSKNPFNLINKLQANTDYVQGAVGTEKPRHIALLFRQFPLTLPFYAGSFWSCFRQTLPADLLLSPASSPTLSGTPQVWEYILKNKKAKTKPSNVPPTV